jgi:hypothetical protein
MADVPKAKKLLKEYGLKMGMYFACQHRQLATAMGEGVESGPQEDQDHGISLAGYLAECLH